MGISSLGKYAWEIILKMNFLGRPDNIGEDIVRFVAGMGTWELSFPTRKEGEGEGKGGERRGEGEQLQEITTS